MNQSLVTIIEATRSLEHLYRKIAANHVGEMTLHKRHSDDCYTQAIDDALEDMGGELAALKKAVGVLSRCAEEHPNKDNDIVMFAERAASK